MGGNEKFPPFFCVFVDFFLYICEKSCFNLFFDMLNIDDIKRRLAKYPEPEEVKNIREQIRERFSNLKFVEDGHKYYLNYPDGRVKEMNSVSSVCHMFEPKVDWDAILERKAASLGVEKDVLGREWKENNITSTSNGTLTHLFAEAYMYFFMGDVDSIPEVIKKMQYEDGFLIPYGEKQQAVARYYEDMYDIPNFFPVMPETQIYIDSENNEYGISHDIAGTFDALFAVVSKDGEISLSIRDWKTNKSLYNSYNEAKSNTMLYPFNTAEYIDEPKSHYTIQLSLYQIGLEPLGYNISDRKLLWLTNEGEYHKVDVPDVTDKLKESLSETKLSF